MSYPQNGDRMVTTDCSDVTSPDVYTTRRVDQSTSYLRRKKRIVPGWFSGDHCPRWTWHLYRFHDWPGQFSSSRSRIQLAPCSTAWILQTERSRGWKSVSCCKAACTLRVVYHTIRYDTRCCFNGLDSNSCYYVLNYSIKRCTISRR